MTLNKKSFLFKSIIIINTFAPNGKGSNNEKLTELKEKMKLLLAGGGRRADL